MLDGRAGTVTLVQQDRDPACPYHRPIGATTVLAVGPGDRIGDLLRALGPGCTPLAWSPVVLAVSCPACGYRSDQTAPADAPPGCPRCGAVLRRRTTLELPLVRQDVPLAAIGIPPREILAFR